MSYQTKNIISGAAALYFSTLSSDDENWAGSVELPAYDPLVSMRDTLEEDAGWQSAGFTMEGVEVEYTPEFKDVEVDQLLDAASIYKTSQTLSVNTTLAEGTLENLQIVWAMPADALAAFSTHETGFGGDTLVAGDKELGIAGGSLGDAPIERSLAFVGSAPRKQGRRAERVYHLRRVLQTESSSFGLRRAEETVFPVSFRCMPDPSYVDAEYGTFRDRVYASSGGRVNPVVKEPVVDDPTTPEDETELNP